MRKPGGCGRRYRVKKEGEWEGPPVRRWGEMGEGEKERIRMAYQGVTQRDREDAKRDRALLLAEWRGRRAEWRESRGEVLTEWDRRWIVEGQSAERELERLGVRMRYT